MRTTLLRLTRRLILLTAGSCIVLAAAWLALDAMLIVQSTSLSFGGISLDIALANQPFETRVSWLLAALTAAGIGMFFMLVAIRRDRERRQWVVLNAQQTGVHNATIRISERALGALANRVTNTIDGVRQSSSTIALGKKGWDLRCRLQLWTEARIPEVVGKLERDLRASFEHHTGLPVARVQIETDFEPVGIDRRVV